MKKFLIGIISSLIMVYLSVSMVTATEIVIATPEEIEGTDIQQVEWENIVHQLLSSYPFRFNKDMSTMVPDVVSDWKLSKDGKKIRFTLDKGMKFSNGKPLTPAAFIASYDRYLKISPYASDLDNLEKMTIEGDDVVMHWKEPPVTAFASVGSSYGAIVDAEAANSVSAEAFNRNVVSYGPMMVDEWVQGSHISLKRNPYYRTHFPDVKNKGPLKIDKVTVRFIPDSFTRVTEILSGSVDVIYDVPVENVDELKADPNIVLHSQLQQGCALYYLNPEAPGLTDVRVRRALQRAINRDELMILLGNHAQPRYGILSPAMVGYHKGAEDGFKKKYGFDLEEARKLLDEAGWKDTDGDGIREKDGKDLQLTAMVALDNPISKKTAPIIQAQLKKLGVDLQLREYENKYIKKSVKDKKFDLATRYYVWIDGDMLSWLFHTMSGYYSFPELDAIIDKGRYVTDPQKRAEIYAEAQEAVLDMGLTIPLVSSIEYRAVRKNIKGFFFMPDGSAVLNDVIKE